MKTKRLHLTRHAQAEHNVAFDYTIPDAKLTPLGRTQAASLNHLSASSYQSTAELIVSSPMRRPLETMILGYPSLLSRLESAGKPPVILDILQEVNRHACDTPTYPPEAIKGDEELGHLFKDLDFSGLDPGYASKEGIFAPESVKERAARVRKWLYDRPEKEIVVVAHGDILRHIADARPSSRQWDNAENKVFTFASEDPELPLKEVDDADEVEPKDATKGPTSSEID